MPSPSTPLRLLIADDHSLLREGLAATLQKTIRPPVQIVGEACNGAEAVLRCGELLPDVVLMDVAMPDMGGPEATTRIKEAYPQVGVIALSGYGECSVVIEMLVAGVDGYLLKDTSATELGRALEAVASGKPYYTPAVLPCLHLKFQQERAARLYPRRALTPREVEVVRLICEGKTSKEIAAALSLSKRTIDSYREKIRDKTGAQSNVALLQYALAHKLVKLG